MCPSVPSFPTARGEAERPTARREYTSVEAVDSGSAILPAGAGFIEVAQFGAPPDSITVYTNSAFTQLRLSNRGEAPRTTGIFAGTAPIELQVRCDRVEAADPTGAGAGRVTALGRYASRNIDRRESRRGPLDSDVRPREQGAPEQLEPR
jgi:hypothetical protein